MLGAYAIPNAAEGRYKSSKRNFDITDVCLAMTCEDG